MPVPLALAAGGVALAAYLDAKLQISNDLHYIRSGSLTSHLAAREASNTISTYYNFQQHAKNQPDHLFLIYEDNQLTYTYAQFFNEIHKAGNWLINSLGVQKGEVVALDFTNRPEYLILWFALDAIGAVTAKVNCNLRERALVHCVKICNARYLITDPECQDNVETGAEEIRAAGTEIIYFTDELKRTMTDQTPIPEERRSDITLDSTESLLFTSGTTGLPKATIFAYNRALLIARFVSNFLRITSEDRYCTCMPLYHGAAHGLCTLPVISAGATIVLGKKFSHKTFWPTAVATGATKAQYVGELLRYLLAAPPGPLDKAHKIKLVFGNGLRPDIWEQFRERFNIPVIVELYAASDGVNSSFNYNSGPFGRYGIARRGALARFLLRKTFVLFKCVDEELVRDPKTGFAVKAAVNEPGEAMSEIEPELLDSSWKGYYGNKDAGDKRLVRDVLKKGDIWFRSGDLLRVDEDGVYYFVDRLGDTFRWRSENVSTNEVSDVISQHPQLSEANVYGIALPYHDGRCGCAAIVFQPGVTEGSFDFDGLAELARRELPKYAVPLFLRITDKVETTGNLKQLKTVVRSQGADLEKIGERVYWLKEGRYVPFEIGDWERLKTGQVKL